MRARQLWKITLLWFNVRILYSRITLTRYTTCYFLLATAACLVQVFLQAATFSDNTKSLQIMSNILAEANVPPGFPIIQDNTLRLCDSIPGQAGTHCIVVSGPASQIFSFEHPKAEITEIGQEQATSSVANSSGRTSFDPFGNLQSVIISDGNSAPQILSGRCAVSLTWLDYILRDEKSEDVATLIFQVWLLGLSVVTILNESIPHLFAVLASHILDTVWAGFRIYSTIRSKSLYQKFVVQGSCSGLDVDKMLWDARMLNAIAVVIINGTTFLGVLYLSLNLFQFYKVQTVKRIGTSTRVNTAYTFVLVISVSLQLAGFFILASTALWIFKVSSSMMRHMADNFLLYQVAFIVAAVLEIPWLVLGWISIRREKRRLLVAFCFLGLVLVVISSVMFASILYRFVFNMWPFFATITVFAHTILVATCVFGIVFRLQCWKDLSDWHVRTCVYRGHIINRWEMPLPDERIQPFFAENPEKSIFKTITVPAPAVVKENIGCTARDIRSML